MVLFGTIVTTMECKIFQHVDYVRPFYNAIKYGESFTPSFDEGPPTTLGYSPNSIHRRKTSSGKHLALFYAHKRLTQSKAIIHPKSHCHPGMNKSLKHTNRF
jgi:hypothetical protein